MAISSDLSAHILQIRNYFRENLVLGWKPQYLYLLINYFQVLGWKPQYLYLLINYFQELTAIFYVWDFGFVFHQVENLKILQTVLCLYVNKSKFKSYG